MTRNVSVECFQARARSQRTVLSWPVSTPIAFIVSSDHRRMVASSEPLMSVSLPDTVKHLSQYEQVGDHAQRRTRPYQTGAVWSSNMAIVRRRS